VRRFDGGELPCFPATVLGLAGRIDNDVLGHLFGVALGG
jgi:hypothetical protein